MSQFASHPLQETMGPTAWAQLKYDVQHCNISWPIGVIRVANFASERPNEATAEIISERGKVYGDPKENHDGIAMQWAPMLQPHWEAIRDMKPLPAHVVALLMVLVKVNRMRLVYHEDNFSDAANYLDFAEGWQRDGKA
jgi:hypothetical protein